MDVIKLSDSSLKLKGKKAAFIIEPFEKMPKNNADAVILFSPHPFDESRIDEYRVVISSAGEYEVNRAKINAVSTGKGTVYSFLFDGINVLLGRASDLNLLADKNQEHKVAIIMADSEIKESVVTAIEPSLAIVYGEKAEEGIKALGKEKTEVEITKKLSFSEDKLPEEMKVVML